MITTAQDASSGHADDTSLPWILRPRPRWLSLLNIVVGIAVFMWLSPDERGWVVVGYGWALAALTVINGWFGWRTKPRRRHWQIVAMVSAGGIMGVSAAIYTAGLMLLKTALHNHVYPDYPLSVIIGIFARLPAWATAGALIGAASAVWLATVSPQPTATNHEQS